MLLLVGGETDPQIAHFQMRLAEAGVPHRALLYGGSRTPELVWTPMDGVLKDSFGPIEPTGAFMRQDVFRYLSSGKQQDMADSRSWKVLFDGFLASKPSVKIFNRQFMGRDAVNKPMALILAQEAGLKVPRTTVHASKALAQEMLDEPTIYKPINGGDMCRELNREELEKVSTRVLPRPYIFQERLEPPELRVFRVGDQVFGFDVSADALDYRTVGNEAVVTPREVPKDLIAPLMKLSDTIGLTYTAADFKVSAEDGEFCFLEINSNPMFMGFDIASNGALVRAMIEYLTSG